MATLVTGGTGFLGSYVLESLSRRGEEVVSLANTPLIRNLRLDREVDFVQGEIADMDLILRVLTAKQVSCVVHLAGLVSSLAQRSPRLATMVNCGGTANVLEAARLAGVPRVVFASSVQVYGPAAKSDSGIDEDYPCNPGSVYGATKLFGERLGINYSELYGIEFVALRMSACYGYANIVSKKELSGNRVEQVQKIVEYPVAGKPVRIAGKGSELMDYVYAGDAAESIASAATKNGHLWHQVYNISSGELHTMDDFAAAVRRLVPGARIEFEGGPDNSLYPQLGPFTTMRARLGLGHEPQGFASNVEKYLAMARAGRE